MRLENIYKGKRAAIIGGRKGVDYSSVLRDLGFSGVRHSRGFNRRELLRIPSIVKFSDLALLIGQVCSHTQADILYKACEKYKVPSITVPRSAGTKNLLMYLLENYHEVNGLLRKYENLRNYPSNISSLNSREISQ